ncbi:MAG: PVC-type heme-binding CxxCH protein, partial [Balneolaceae bacterium]
MWVADGYTVEKVSGPDLTSYPMFATSDHEGRLFVFESTGPNTMSTEEMLENPSYRISILKDLTGDGVYDESKVFADSLPLPQGGYFYQGSLYVSASPDLLRLTDTTGDGVADQREVILTGWTLNVNACTLQGPFFGPDGWLYMPDCRRGYRIETKEGDLLEGKGARIWRVRPDGTGLEWVSAGGFDNAIELAFMPSGEVIGTMTYFTNPQHGQRDALMHWVEGGVYPKSHSVIEEDELIRTGDLMPVMTKLPRVAPAGLHRYRGIGNDSELKNNLFSAHFNTGRVIRSEISRDGATFKTEDEEFFYSNTPRFHPTDVLEDADGSLLV